MPNDVGPNKSHLTESEVVLKLVKSLSETNNIPIGTREEFGIAAAKVRELNPGAFRRFDAQGGESQQPPIAQTQPQQPNETMLGIPFPGSNWQRAPGELAGDFSKYQEKNYTGSAYDALKVKDFKSTKPLFEGTGAAVGTALGLAASAPTAGTTSLLTVPILAGAGAFYGGLIHDGITMLDVFPADKNNPLSPVNVDGVIMNPKDENEAQRFRNWQLQFNAKSSRNWAFIPEVGSPVAAEVAKRVMKSSLVLALRVGSKEAFEKAAQMSSIGGAAITDVSGHKIVAAFARTLGVLPGVSTPFTKNIESRQAAILGKDGALNRLLWSNAPIATMGESGMALSRYSTAGMARFKKRGGVKYEIAKSRLREEGAEIPFDNIQAESKRIRNKIWDDSPKKDVTKKTKIGVVEGRPVYKTEKVREAINFERFKTLESMLDKVDSINVKMTIDEYQVTAMHIGDAISEVGPNSKEGMFLLRLKSSLEADMINSRASDDAKEMWRAADEYWTKTMAIFETPGANRIGIVKRNLGNPKLVLNTTHSPSELADIFLKDSRKDIVQDLWRIANQAGSKGRKDFKQMVSAHIEDTIMKLAKGNNELGIEVIKPGLIAEALGFDKPGSDKYKAFAEMIKHTDINMSDMKRFISVADAAFKDGVPTVAGMQQRRVQLQGVRGLTGLLSFGAASGATGGGLAAGAPGAVGGLLTGALATWGLSRGIAELVSRPGVLRALTNSIDPNLARAGRESAQRTFFRMIPAASVMRQLRGDRSGAVDPKIEAAISAASLGGYNKLGGRRREMMGPMLGLDQQVPGNTR